MKASVFVGTSLDGFIARADGAFDFLPADGGEPHGYDEFMATVDALVIGRKTFETVLGFGEWAYGKKPVFVLSSRAIAPAPPGAVVERMSGAPAAIVSQLEARGIQHVVRGWRDHHSAISTGRPHSSPHYHTGSGAHRRRDPALWPSQRDIPLKHVATRQYASGLVQSEYLVDVGHE